MACRKPPLKGASVSAVQLLLPRVRTFMLGYQIYLNGQVLPPASMYKISAFVEQEDALLGVLTVRESVAYSLRLQ